MAIGLYFSLCLSIYIFGLSNILIIIIDKVLQNNNSIEDGDDDDKKKANKDEIGDFLFSLFFFSFILIFHNS